MTTSRQWLLHAIESYTTSYTEEFNFLPPFVELLRHPRAYFRDHLPGHMTGSAWIIDETKQFVLLTHHAKLNKWLQPGGHADGDENIFQVSLREAEEETGLKDLILLQNSVFDFDIHTIPARLDFPQHLHFDVRFVFQISQEKLFTVSDESFDLEWVPLYAIADRTNHNMSMIRMAEKVKLL